MQLQTELSFVTEVQVVSDSVLQQAFLQSKAE